MGDKKKPFFHYRNAFKSDHLAIADIEEMIENKGNAILTVKKVEYQENRKVAGKVKDRCLVAFFKEKDTKPLIVNSINSKILRSFIGSNDLNNDWCDLNLPIELYVNESVKMAGQIVGGIRIKTRQPTVAKTQSKKTISPASFAKAKIAVQAGEFTVEQVMSKYSLTEDQQKELNG